MGHKKEVLKLPGVALSVEDKVVFSCHFQVGSGQVRKLPVPIEMH